MSGQPSADPGRRGTPAGRLLRGIAALATLLGLLVVVPMVLFAAGGDPLPRHLPSPGAIGHALTTTDQGGHLFIGVALVVAWVAWLAFALSTLLEVAARLRNRPPLRIPGLRVPQRAAAGLLGAVAMMLGTVGPAVGAYAADAPAPPAAVQTVTTAPAPGTVLVYQVRAGDDLGSIAHRFLGSFADYPRIAQTNPGLITPHAGADHIEAGWRLRLPAGARDRGVRPHADGVVTVGTVITPRAATAGDPAPGVGVVFGAPVPAPADGPAVTAPTEGLFIGAPVADPAPPVGPPLVVFGTAVPAPEVVVTGTSASTDHLSPGLLIAAGGLATGVLGAHLTVWRQRRRPGSGTWVGSHAAGLRPVPDPEPAGTGTAAEFNRLDLALRHLLGLLGGRDAADLPDIMGSWLVDGDVHLMLTRDCPAPPAPWVAKGLIWTLPAAAPARAYVAGSTAPLPALVTVGGDDERRVFLDLERLGVVTIGGDPQGATDLLRHVGAELCHGVWSEGVTVGIAGFDREDTQQLVALGGGRVRASDSAADALEGVARWIGEAHDRLSGLGATDVLSGRVAAGPSEATRLSPYALLLAGPDAADLERLERLDAYLAGLGRGQVAIAATTQANLGRWPMRVGADRHVTMDFLETRVPAVSLAGAELATLTDVPEAPTFTPGRVPAGGLPVGRHRMNRRMPVS